ncbi:hypothetical protein [Coraliomargarita parva]|uniref:hypothetical protein n=1 Tax=Coraliomargarita parva TaxID=3014050 RepID=UPI0022B4FA4B|nr:hypothetical protein [Coraliomargarita parva]
MSNAGLREDTTSESGSGEHYEGFHVDFHDNLMLSLERKKAAETASTPPTKKTFAAVFTFIEAQRKSPDVLPVEALALRETVRFSMLVYDSVWTGKRRANKRYSQCRFASFESSGFSERKRQ